MRNAIGRDLALTTLLGFSIMACAPANSSPPMCIPGDSKACVGASGCAGGQVCQDTGSYGECLCGASDAGNAQDANTGRDANAGVDSSRTDVGPGDAAVASDRSTGTDASVDGCNPETQEPCASPARCTWVRIAAEQGHFGCVAAGSVAAQQTCTVGASGESTGFDDCQRGLFCSGTGDTCKAICTLTSDNCASHFACQQFAGVFANNGAQPAYGLCEATCNPLTQTRDFDGAPACGSPNPAQPSLGCVGRPDFPFTCAHAGDPNRTSDVPAADHGGQVYLNSCAPGYLPLLRRSNADSTVLCIALCQPGPTDQSSPANAAGLVGSAYTCPARGAGGTHECRYWWWLEDMTAATWPTSLSNTIGYCIDYTQYQYDSNNDTIADTTFPSCTTLTSGDSDGNGTADTLDWGCAPHL